MKHLRANARTYSRLVASLACAAVLATTLLAVSASSQASGEEESNYPLIKKLEATKCSTDYIPSGVGLGLLRNDCRALVAAQNLWADTEFNRNLGPDHPLRTWGNSGNITNWAGVTVHNNRVSGLDISGLGIFGELPWQIGQLSALQTLNISNNLFNGNLPFAWANLAETRVLSYIPQTATGSLTYFNFCYNHLTGDIPVPLASTAGVLFAGDNDYTITCQRPGLPAVPPTRILGYSYAEVLAGGAVVSKLVTGLGLQHQASSDISQAAPIYVWNQAESKWKQATVNHCIARSDPSDPSSDCTNWRQTTLPAGSIFYYIDGYSDSATLQELNLRQSSKEARLLTIIFPPTPSPSRPTTTTTTTTTTTPPGSSTASTTPEPDQPETMWNTFTVSSWSRVTVAQIREQLNLGEDRDIYVWNGERQAWTEVPSETAVLPEGAVVTFETAEEVSEEDLDDLNLAAGTQYATLTPGWTILSSSGTTSRLSTRSRDFFLTSALIDCSSRNYVLAVASYNSDNGRWYLWLPCHPRQEEALTQRGSAFRRLMTMNAGDMTWIYCRCTGNRHIQWNADILKYEPL